MELMTEEKKNFKRTDIGLIPEDWEVVQLGDIINYTKGFAFKSAEYSDSGVRIVRVSDVKKGEIKKDGGVFIPHTRSSKYSNWALNANDIIVSTVGSKPPLYESIVGKPYLVKKSESGYLLNQNAVKLRVNNDSKYSQDLLYHHFEVRRYYEHIEEIFRGNANQASITLESLFKYKIPLPPTLSEQQAIASALSDVDELIRSLDGLIQKKQAIKKGTMQQLLTGKKRLPGFHGEWEEKNLKEISDCLDNLRVPLNESQRNQMRGNIPYCGANGVLDYVDDYVIDDDIILMAEDGGYFDEYKTRPIAYRMNGKCWVNNHAHILKAKDFYNQSFLFYSLVHKDIQDYITGGTRAKLNKGNMLKIEVFSPNDKEEQKAITQILSDMDRELQSLRQKQEKYVQIKQGMMQQLLTGRIRIFRMDG